MPTKLVYFTLGSARDGVNDAVDYRDNPELHVAYTTPEAAMEAGTVALSRVADSYRTRLAAYDPTREASAALRAWEDPKKSACLVETRITDAAVTWDQSNAPRERMGVLSLTTESRHRWRDVEMHTVVAKNGTTTITHAFAKPLPWTKWQRGHNGGLYVPQQVAVVVRAVTLTFAEDRAELARWVGTP